MEVYLCVCVRALLCHLYSHGLSPLTYTHSRTNSTTCDQAVFRWARELQAGYLHVMTRFRTEDMCARQLQTGASNVAVFGS